MSNGPLPHIDAASLVAFPAERPTKNLHSRSISTAQSVCADVMRDKPLLTHVWNGPYGRVGIIILPVVDMTLFEDDQKTVEAAVEGVQLASDAGAQCVSFTGMIPAATGYGTKIAEYVGSSLHRDSRQRIPQLTTGHAAVIAAFALNVEAILKSAGRVYADEHVAFVGIGSIGSGILKLLSNQSAPKVIYVVDVHEKKAQLARLKTEINAEIEVVSIDKNAGLPSGLYDRCSLFLSATSTPLVIDVDQLKPGALVVDDSFPFGFDSEKAVARISSASDIMITIAGGLQGPEELDLVYTAPQATQFTEFALLLNRMEKMVSPWPRCMTGCVYSSLLTNHYDLPATLGPVLYEDGGLFLEKLRAEGFCGTPPHIFTFDPNSSKPTHAMPTSQLEWHAGK